MPILSKLPSWVWGGASLLALVAGCINVVCILAARQTVSHMTGNNSEVVVQAARGNIPEVIKLLGVIGSFLAGAIISGCVVQDSTLKLGRRYGAVLVLETVALLIATILLRHGQMLGIDMAALACGLQNAMVSTYSGAIVRTTHLTGIFTDLGILIGHRLRGLPADGRRVRLFVLIIGGFACGGLIGTAGFRWFGVNTLLVPATLTGSAATAYAVIALHSRLK